VLGQRHRLCLGACQAVNNVAEGFLAHGCRAAEARCRAFLWKPSLSTTASRPQAVRSVMGAEDMRAAVARLPGCQAAMPCHRACLRGTPALEEIRLLFWPTCMQRDDLRRRTLRELTLAPRNYYAHSPTVVWVLPPAPPPAPPQNSTRRLAAHRRNERGSFYAYDVHVRVPPPTGPSARYPCNACQSLNGKPEHPLKGLALPRDASSRPAYSAISSPVAGDAGTAPLR
jgi:hypothetical protein